ncbi:MAG: hypothetical protein K9N11_02515 [Lentisphaeria bacterium]|nr:hypothetical protein [Candidatus Neomarinimicrobiota bacterium]MCF7841703.1 hypothetical protein [Lentisphaeria bacterium]
MTETAAVLVKPVWNFGHLDFEFVCDLMLGIWAFLSPYGVGIQPGGEIECGEMIPGPEITNSKFQKTNKSQAPIINDQNSRGPG